MDFLVHALLIEEISKTLRQKLITDGRTRILVDARAGALRATLNVFRRIHDRDNTPCARAIRF